MECTKDKNLKDCPCTYTSCDKRGVCCKCVAYHRAKGQMVACYFTPEAERTYDRSTKAFLAQFK
ncbi:hypothetical protein EPN96_09485 [bacterium]|nr:MAG: hypothetical protein EPN96_09485 [bacterium]